MNKAEIRKRLLEIESWSSQCDAPHEAEDRLYRDFVASLAESDSDLAPLATLALSSQNIKFKRCYE